MTKSALIFAIAITVFCSTSVTAQIEVCDSQPPSTVIVIHMPVKPTFKQRVGDAARATGRAIKATPGAVVKTVKATPAATIRAAKATGRGIMWANAKLQPAAEVASTVMTLGGAYYFMNQNFVSPH